MTPRRPFTRAAEVKGSASAEHELPALLGEIQTQENVADFGILNKPSTFLLIIPSCLHYFLAR